MKTLSHKEQFDCKLNNKEEIQLMKELCFGTESEEVQNPLSKVKCILAPEAVALYDFMIGSQIAGFKTDHHIDQFYTARDIFITNWPKQYMILLD